MKMMREVLCMSWLVIGCGIGLLAVTIWGSQCMSQEFFSRSTTPPFVLDYWLAE